MFGVQAQQLVLKSRKLEEIIFFFHGLGRSATLRAWSSWPDNIHVKLVENAILPDVLALVDVAVVANLAPESLHSLFVALGRSTDEIVIGEAQAVPQRTKFGGNVRRELLRRLACGLGCALDLLPVLVSASKKICVVAHHALPPRDRVACDRCIGMTDMRSRIHVVDGRGDVESFAHCLVNRLFGNGTADSSHILVAQARLRAARNDSSGSILTLRYLANSAGRLPASHLSAEPGALRRCACNHRIRAHSSSQFRSCSRF